MKKHIKIYLKHNPENFLPCEVCGAKAVDIHHIDNKGMGGSKMKDYYENLIALCRDCHNKAHNEELTKDYLREIHMKNLQ